MTRYTETPVDPDDAAAFVDGVSFGTKAEVDAAEDAALVRVLSAALQSIDDGTLTLDDLLSPGTLRDLHETVFEGIWQWAGAIRTRAVNIGSAPESIRMDLRAAEDDLAYMRTATGARELAMTAHWKLVRVHPFVDGNGRITRLLADAVVFALTGDQLFDWVGGREYYAALRDADRTLSVDALLALVPPLRAA